MKKIQWIVIGLGLLSILAYGISSLEFENTSIDYAGSIALKRAEIERFFKRSPESPVKNIKDFPGLDFYPPDINYKIEVSLELLPSPENIMISTGKSKPENYLKFAWANFELKGKKHRLLLLKQNLQDPFLFLAFSDLTSGKATYGGGRYLNIPYQNGQKSAVLDFNLAYHPYCVYNPDYVCPLPPAENHLAVAVEAGERLK
ncbi:MAG: DUF1684 domain-containing protein [Microscillaceae bacterium]|nr:DUF1684 domain-containing protein [Microscillaceae bacterium]